MCAYTLSVPPLSAHRLDGVAAQVLHRARDAELVEARGHLGVDVEVERDRVTSAYCSICFFMSSKKRFRYTRRTKMRRSPRAKIQDFALHGREHFQLLEHALGVLGAHRRLVGAGHHLHVPLITVMGVLKSWITCDSSRPMVVMRWPRSRCTLARYSRTAWTGSRHQTHQRAVLLLEGPPAALAEQPQRAEHLLARQRHHQTRVHGEGKAPLDPRVEVRVLRRVRQLDRLSRAHRVSGQPLPCLHAEAIERIGPLGVVDVLQSDRRYLLGEQQRRALRLAGLGQRRQRGARQILHRLGARHRALQLVQSCRSATRRSSFSLVLSSWWFF
jgi:hypothetical protein